MEKRLHATVPHSRFWRIALDGLDLVIRSGAEGTPGTLSRIPCKSEDSARKTFESLVAQRLKDGFVDEASAPGSVLSLEAERALLNDDPQGWLVFSDALQESGDAVRGQFVALQVKTARRVRGSITESKEYLRKHFDELVGPEVASVHTQVTFDWKFGYARTARVWSGPYTQPVGDVIEPVLNSPACRFLQRLELGSPGTEGRYDDALRQLAALEWPTHLDSLGLGEFDVEAAARSESAWPRLESLLALTPVASRVGTLEVRAALNTLGKGLAFPNLERLALRPWQFHSRLLTDLLVFEVPRLKTLSLSAPGRIEQMIRAGESVEAWASVVRRFIDYPGIQTLELCDVQDAALILELVGERLGRLHRLVLFGDVDVRGLAPLSATLSKTQLECPDDAEAARALVDLGFKVNGPTPETLKKMERARKARERARERQTYENFME